MPAFLGGMVAGRAAAAPSATTQRVACAVSLESVLEMVKRTAGGAADADAPLMEAGVDSLGAVELRTQLQRAVGEGVALPSTLVFDYPTARQVMIHLQGSSSLPAGVQGCDALRAAGGAEVEIAGHGLTMPSGVSDVIALREMSQCNRDLLRVIPSARWDVE